MLYPVLNFLLRLFENIDIYNLIFVFEIIIYRITEDVFEDTEHFYIFKKF